MSRKHTLLMIAGCVLPMAAVAAVFLFRIQVNTVILVAMLLLCPLVHFLMMKEHDVHGPHGPQQTAKNDTPTVNHDLTGHQQKELP